MNGNDAWTFIWQELEKCLKTTCEEFIMSVTKLVVDPMLSFVTKVGFSSSFFFLEKIAFQVFLRFEMFSKKLTPSVSFLISVCALQSIFHLSNTPLIRGVNE